MRVREVHQNGSVIELRGLFRVNKALKEWRDRQEEVPKKEDPEDSRPKVTGVSAQVHGSGQRDYQISKGRIPEINAETPFKFGFQPNPAAPVEPNTYPEV